MAINFEGSVINLRDKLANVDRKRPQSDNAQGVEKKSQSSATPEKRYIADVIGIRNENRLAAASQNIVQTQEEALDILEDLKKQFAENSSDALNAHKKAQPDSVMQFYPFE